MNTSLPFLPPRDAHSLWYTPTHFPATTTAPPTSNVSSSSNPGTNAHTRGPSDRQPKRPGERPFPRPSALAQLIADEAEIRKRKANVARFGATWIRPPGVGKTYQAMVDEAAERAEQDALAAREQAAAEQQAAWEAQEEATRRAAAAARGRPTGGFGGDMAEAQQGGFEGEDQMDERDLDDDVPDADDDAFGLSGEDDDDDDEVDLDATDEADLMESERDLDDVVPEAGSYQHTDTDVEDDSTDPGFSSPARVRQQSVPANQQSSPVGHGPTVVQDFRQPSLDALPIPRFTSSPAQAESSMLASSPGIPRARTHGQPRRPGNRLGAPEWASQQQPSFHDYGQP